MAKHHFIPAFYLRQWTNSDDELIEYSRPHHQVVGKSIGPQGTGYEYDLYVFDDLPPEDAQFLERKFFNYADNVGSVALRQHLSNVNRSSWTPELVSAWSRFVMGLHVRHPDSMSELRLAARNIWDASGTDLQKQYERLKRPQDPPTLDDFLSSDDPHVHAKARVHLIAQAVLDNEDVGRHVNNMLWVVLDVSMAPHRLLTSDRPVQIAGLNGKRGHLMLPISPTKVFVAANSQSVINDISALTPKRIVENTNQFTVSRARRYVWAVDRSQERFIQNRMSQNLEPKPFFPNLSRFG